MTGVQTCALPICKAVCLAVLEQAEEIECLKRQLENKSKEIGRSEHRGNTVDYIYDKCQYYGNQLLAAGNTIRSQAEDIERLKAALIKINDSVNKLRADEEKEE